MEILRQTGISALGTILKNQNNITILENNIFNITPEGDEDLYKRILYQVIGDIIDGNKLKSISENIRNLNVNWKHHIYDDINFRINEQDEFILHPFEVEEGVLMCNKCGSNRTFSYAKQTRSCDEGTSVYATCTNCHASWTHSG